MKDLLFKAFVKPAKKYPALFLTVAGALATFVGAIFGNLIDAVPYIPRGTGEAILKIGSAILGGGVFAVLMKSSQFSDFFQKCLSDVFYDPGATISLPVLKEKWLALTRGLLKDTLPASYQNASEVILESFFNNELEHHFENYRVTYDFNLDENGRDLVISHSVETEVVISPRFESTNISHNIVADGSIKLVSLVVDGHAVSLDKKYLSDAENDPSRKCFSIKLSPSVNSVGKDRSVTLERVFEVRQDIAKEPYYIVNVSRYIKGFSVKYRASNCQVFFENTGLGAGKDLESKVDGNGYTRTVLADKNTLLLPGQGYIFIVTASHKAEV
ncbi:hypothetical protein [uncultured Pseudomonas sp.]|uniref:hypothetical protein n=1 Tax=uncultured Pseudomonas sp. TaxID=114707 RepID=UPI00258E498E|nr:hypothetical protein [uncultured Pseudomonas sp.]